MAASTKPNETHSFHTYDDITGYCHFSFVFQPIAIAKRDTPHIFTIKFGGGGATFRGETWRFERTTLPNTRADNSYLYSEFYSVTLGLELGYSYQVFGPLYLGSHIGAVTMPDMFYPFYIYAGFTAGIRFDVPSKKAAE